LKETTGHLKYIGNTENLEIVNRVIEGLTSFEVFLHIFWIFNFLAGVLLTVLTDQIFVHFLHDLDFLSPDYLEIIFRLISILIRRFMKLTVQKSILNCCRFTHLRLIWVRVLVVY
jgi:hypothetical protein